MMQLIKLQFKNFQETEIKQNRKQMKIVQKYHIAHTYILHTKFRLKHRKNLCSGEVKEKLRWALPVYPVFKDKKSNGSKIVGQEKNRMKKTNRTNIIATNFV